MSLGWSPLRGWLEYNQHPGRPVMMNLYKSLSGQISIIPKPELRGFLGGIPLLFTTISGDQPAGKVVIIYIRSLCMAMWGDDKFHMCHGQGCRVLLGMGDLPPLMTESLLWCPINPYYWVDDHPLLYIWKCHGSWSTLAHMYWKVWRIQADRKKTMELRGPGFVAENKWVNWSYTPVI